MPPELHPINCDCDRCTRPADFSRRIHRQKPQRFDLIGSFLAALWLAAATIIIFEIIGGLLP